MCHGKGLAVAGTATADLKNKDQARRLGYAALEFIGRTHQQKVTREIVWADIRATPRNQCDLIKWIPKTVLHHLYDTMETWEGQSQPRVTFARPRDGRS